MSFAVSGAAAAGGGLSILKDLAIDKPAAAKQLALQAKTAEFSPWTGLKPQAVAQPNLGQGPYANVQMAGDPGAQTAALNGMVS